MSFEREKQAAARAAVAEVADGMIVGLGTGSTAGFAVEALAERCRAGLRIEAVATSLRTEALARESGIKLLDFAALDAVDLSIDGVDQIDNSLNAIKGAGGAMLREKVIAQAARRRIAVADSSKVVDWLGNATVSVPVEILPFALGFVSRRIKALGGQPTLRETAPTTTYHTDQGNLVLDCHFTSIDNPLELSLLLSEIPGLLGHGVFVGDIDTLYLGVGDAVERRDA